MTTTNRPAADVGGTLTLGYAALSYLLFLGVSAWAVGFFADVGVPRSLDRGPDGPTVVAVTVDLALLGLFAVQHSMMARASFKRVWTRVVPPAAERATYVLATDLVLVAQFALWRPVGGVVWDAPGPVAVLLRGTAALGWLLVVVSTFQVDHADLFGLRQAWARYRGVAPTPPPFRQHGLYRRVRHPLMLGFLVVFWSAPRMTAGHLLFAAAASAYVALGVLLEERDLVRDLGPTYTDYRRRVPALVPWRRPR